MISQQLLLPRALVRIRLGHSRANHRLRKGSWEIDPSLVNFSQVKESGNGQGLIRVVFQKGSPPGIDEYFQNP